MSYVAKKFAAKMLAAKTFTAKKLMAKYWTHPSCTEMQRQVKWMDSVDVCIPRPDALSARLGKQYSLYNGMEISPFLWTTCYTHTHTHTHTLNMLYLSTLRYMTTLCLAHLELKGIQ